MGGCRPARLHRVPARLVAQPAAVRVRARAARVRREAPDLGRRQAQLHAALPRAAAGDGDGRAARPGSCPGLPDELRGRILERAEGVPLYAVETVRMLLDRGLLDPRRRRLPSDRRRSSSWRCRRRCRRSSRPASTGSRPRSAASSRTARCSGKTFTKQGLAALTGLARIELEPILAALLRKEVLSVQADPLSPERGQYAFLQDIVKRVAYETISPAGAQGEAPRDGRVPPLAAGERGGRDRRGGRPAPTSMRSSRPPTRPTPPEIRDRAREMLVRAGERAASLAATRRGAARVRACRRSQRRRSRPGGAATSGRAPWRGPAPAARRPRCASSARSSSTRSSDASARRPPRVEARLAEVMWDLGRLEDGLERMNQSFELLVAGRAGRRSRLAGRAARPVPVLRRPVRSRRAADRGCARDGREPRAARRCSSRH